MEKRKITVIPTKTHRTQVIESAATTLAELKADLTKAGIDYTDCTFFEGLTKIELKNDAAILPHDVPYKGTTTNNLVFMITNASKKIRSGAKLDRKAIIEEIKVKNLTEVVKKTYGKNYTNCKTEDLQKILNKETAPATADASAPTAKAAPAKKEVPNKPAMKTTDLSSYVTKAELRKVIESLLKEMEYADVDYIEDVDIDNIAIIGKVSSSNSEEEKSDSPYSPNELDDMFKGM
ncbi:MAG: hypothetical protein [Bacteriophage sp.]|nr:MAG: hypothetical protein [Bacteriophage sp.]